MHFLHSYDVFIWFRLGPLDIFLSSHILRKLCMRLGGVEFWSFDYSFSAFLKTNLPWNSDGGLWGLILEQKRYLF